MRRLPRALLAGALLALLAAPAPLLAKGSLSKVEDEFEKVIQKVTPTTVVCLPWGVDPQKMSSGSSGVIMSRKGLVLSDGDVGIWLDITPGKPPKGDPRKWSDDIEIRIPNLKGKGFASHRAKVLKRNRELDTCLLRMQDPPSGLKYLQAGNSDQLRVGDFTFAMGNSFGLAAEAPPTLTAGVVASLVPPGVTNAKTSGAGRWGAIYTSAAVNPGVNGGPLVDIQGRLVGTISSSVPLVGTGNPQDHPDLAYAYLGKVVPVERLKAAYADLPEAEELFPADEGDDPARRGESAALATVFHNTARKAYGAVVSLKVKRKAQLSLAEPAGGGLVNIPRYIGPVSGVLVSADGYVLTSLYNLANIATLVYGPGWANPPDNAKIQAGIDDIEGITVHLPGGRSVPAKVVARHEGIGVAMLKAEVGNASGALASLEPATDADLHEGRFVLAVGNPFGAERLEDPLLTVGILSKRHSDDTDSPWASQWQTDAGVTDANAGGAAVDLHGKLLGVLTVWSATMHGRNSGIGFIVPWTQIEPVLGELQRGRSFRPPFMGITWKQVGTELLTVLETVLEGSAAAKAGLQPGDEIFEVDGVAVQTPVDVRRALRNKWSGDTLVLRIHRAGAEKQVDLTLGARE